MSQDATGIGVLSKMRYYVNRNILHQLYYSIIYPFLPYGLPIWGNTYSTTLKPLITLQKRAMRTITFSEPAGEHSEALLRKLILLPFHNALLVHHYCYNLLAIFLLKCLSNSCICTLIQYQACF